jgi:hypothetical protein
MEEKELLERREKIEKPALKHFEKFSILFASIIFRITSDYKAGRLNEIEAKERLRIELINVFGGHSELNEEVLETLTRAEYQLGMDHANLEDTFTTTDASTILLLWHTASRYVSIAQHDYIIESYKLEGISEKKIKHRFEQIIISEGSRQINAAVINKASEFGKFLIFHTLEDEKVCPICSVWDGKILHPLDAFGLIPLHPHCRCYFIVAEGIYPWLGDAEGQEGITV